MTPTMSEAERKVAEELWPGWDGAAQRLLVHSNSAADLAVRLQERVDELEKEWTCKHEPFEGRCVHCNIRFIDGEPTIFRLADQRDTQRESGGSK